jgi:hypothetical protein
VAGVVSVAVAIAARTAARTGATDFDFVQAATIDLLTARHSRLRDLAADLHAEREHKLVWPIVVQTSQPGSSLAGGRGAASDIRAISGREKCRAATLVRCDAVI